MRGLNWGYLGRRFGAFLFVVFAAASINFLIPRLAPGNPIGAITSRLQTVSSGIEGGEEMFKAYRNMFGLDDNLGVQYVRYLWNTLRFQFGFSLSSFPAGVLEVIRPSLRWTIGLLTVCIFITFVLGVGAGALMAWRTTPRMIRMLIPFPMMFAVVPYYLLGLLLLYLLAYSNNIFPSKGAYDTSIRDVFSLHFLGSTARHAFLPALSIVLTGVGLWALTTRGLMINVLGEDYLTFAEAKGLGKWRIVVWYALRNAIPPQITQLTIALGHVVSGAVLVEIVFAYPGIGYLLYQAITFSDYTLIQGITYILALSVAAAVLILDLLYPRLDPRVTYVRK